MERQPRLQRVQLPTGVIWAEVEQVGDVPRQRDVSTKEGVPEPLSIDVVRAAIEGLGQVVQEALASFKPDKASVEFGLEVGLESGKLTALWVKGTGKANLKISLTWGK
jgi:hypothetical protein